MPAAPFWATLRIAATQSTQEGDTNQRLGCVLQTRESECSKENLNSGDGKVSHGAITLE